MKNPVRRHRKIKLTVKAALCLIYCVAICEFFLRIFAPVPLVPHGWAVTSYGLRGNESNKTYRHKTPEYSITMRTNSKGLRADREIPYEKTHGIKRIVLLGDSFAMGYGVDLEDTFSSQMRKFMEESGVKTEIVNMGVPTYGNAEELVLLMEEGLKYQPDLVLLAWHPSDYSENVRSGLFGFENGHLVRKNKTYLPNARIGEFLSQFKLYRWIAENSQFYKFVRNVVYLHIRKPIIDTKTKLARVFRPKPHDAYVKTERQNENGQDGPKDNYRTKLTVEILAEIKRECISNSAAFVIFDIPIRLNRTEFKSHFPESDGNIMEYFDVFNPIELFRQHKGEKIYWEKSEGHFTPLGCRIVGKGLADFVLSNNLLIDRPVVSNNSDAHLQRAASYATDEK